MSFPQIAVEIIGEIEDPAEGGEAKDESSPEDDREAERRGSAKHNGGEEIGNECQEDLDDEGVGMRACGNPSCFFEKQHLDTQEEDEWRKRGPRRASPKV